MLALVCVCVTGPGLRMRCAGPPTASPLFDGVFSWQTTPAACVYAGMHWVMLKTQYGALVRFVASVCIAAVFLVLTLTVFPTGLPTTPTFVVETTMVFITMCLGYDLFLCWFDANCTRMGRRRKLLTVTECTAKCAKRRATRRR